MNRLHVLKNSMFCAPPACSEGVTVDHFHKKEMHLLNLEACNSFTGDFTWVSKTIVNLCAIVAFMVPQHEIANFYGYIYLIRTFAENALIGTIHRRRTNIILDTLINLSFEISQKISEVSN